MSLAGSANVTGNINMAGTTLYSNGSITTATGTFTANLFSGNGASITNLDYNKISANKPNVTAATQAASGGGAFSYSTTTGFSFTPASIPTYTTQALTASGSGGISFSGTTLQYTPPDLTNYLTTIPYATTSAWGAVKVSTGLSVTGGVITNAGVVGLTAGTGVSVSGTAGGTFTVGISQSVGTSDSVRFGSLGIGTAATGTAGEIVATNNITAYASSDKKFKENIKPIANALQMVLGIGGKLFDWTDDYLESKGGEDNYFYRKSDFGVIAQDLINAGFEVAVRTREDGSLAVDYEKLVALAFQAIVEQEANHKQELQSLQGQIDTIMNLLKDKQ
jgi:hypothetical protein